MNPILVTLPSAMPCQPHLELGRASALFAFAGAYRCDGGKSIGESLSTVIHEWLNLDQFSSGQCRATLTPR